MKNDNQKIQFDIFGKPDSKTEISFDSKCSHILFNALSKARKADRYNSVSWSKSFQALRKVDKIPKDEIQSVLEWYTGHIGEEYIPEAYSAKSFRTKFRSIQTKMNNTTTEKPTNFSKLGKKVFLSIKDKKWPSGLDLRLPRIIQSSIQEYSKFWDTITQMKEELARLSKSIKRNPNPKKVELRIQREQDSALLGHIIQMGYISPPNEFVPGWFNFIQTTLEKFDSWDGDTKTFVWSLTNPRFQRWGCLWAYNWSNDSQRWLRLVKRIQRFKSKESSE